GRREPDRCGGRAVLARRPGRRRPPAARRRHGGGLLRDRPARAPSRRGMALCHGRLRPRGRRPRAVGRSGRGPPRRICGRDWAVFGAMAAGPMLIGHTGMNYALRYFRATTVNVAALGEPVGATLLAWLIPA